MTYSLNLDSNRQAMQVFEEVDTLVPIILNGNPNGVKAAAFVGMRAYDQITGTEYKCTATDQTVLGTTWEVVINTIVDATTTQVGVVELATAEEVAEGTNNTKAITPFSLGTGLATQASLQTEINTRISADNAINSALDVVELAVSEATSAATPSKIMQRDGAGRVKAVAASAGDDVVIKSQMDTADSTLQGQIDAHQLDLSSSSSSVAPNKLIRRDTNGLFEIGDPTGNNHPVKKSALDTTNSTVSSLSGTVSSHTSTLGAATANASANTLALRDADARLKVADGSAAGDAVNKGQLDALQTVVNKLLGGAVKGDLTLDTNGLATPTGAFFTLDTFASAASDDCSRLVTTNNVPFILVQLANAARIVTLKHNQSGDGKMIMTTGGDIVFSNTSQAVLFAKVGTDYYEITRFGFTGSSVADNFGRNGGRQLPTSGSISGDYFHSGNWTATGALTIAAGTRVFVTNCSTFDMGSYSHVVSTRVGSGGKGRPTSGNNGQNIATGSGPGAAAVGGGAGVSVVASPGGPGFGGRGGRGGSYSDHYMPGGAIYSPREFFGGTGGNSGMHYSSTVTAAVDGGEGGGGFYLEINAPGGTVTLGNLNVNGGNGVNAPDTNYSGSAAGTGGCFVARIRCATCTLPATRVISANGGTSGGVGSGGSANAAAGGPSGGYIDILATSFTNSGTIQANGGAAGSGGSYVASNGSAGQVITNSGYDPTSYW